MVCFLFSRKGHFLSVGWTPIQLERYANFFAIDEMATVYLLSASGLGIFVRFPRIDLFKSPTHFEIFYIEDIVFFVGCDFFN